MSSTLLMSSSRNTVSPEEESLKLVCMLEPAALRLLPEAYITM